MERARVITKAAIMAVAMAMLPFSSAQAAAPCTAYNDPSNPQAATCNSATGYSKLFPNGSTGDHVTIFAPELVNPNDTSANPAWVYKTCRTIINGPPAPGTQSQSYLIPWRTPREWSSFLKAVGAYTAQGIPSTDAAMSSVVSASGCCVPMQLNQLYCPQSGKMVPLSTPILLGGNTVGTRLNANGIPIDPDNNPNSTVPNYFFDETNGATPVNNYALNNWGAAGDAPSNAVASVTKDANGNAVNFEVSFACQPDLALNPAANDVPNINTAGYSGAGGWVEMSWSGSCAPSDGQCATIPNSTLSSLPSNLNMLCAVGSVIDPTSVHATQTGWTWTCKGTGGTGCSWDPNGLCQNSTCAANNSNPFVLGACGLQNGQYIKPSDANVNNPGLCANGTVANFDTTGRITPGFEYTWQCLNSDGSITSPAQNNCAAHINDGACGSDDGSNQTTLTATDPNLCKGGILSGFSTNFTLPGAPTGVGMAWWWLCLNSDGSTTNYNQNTCGAWQGPPNNAQCANLTSTSTAYTSAQMDALVEQCDTTPSQCQLCTQGVYQDGSLSAGSKGTNTYWSWSCDGTNNGSNAACTNEAYNEGATGVCGSDKGKTFTTMLPGPVNLCKTIGTVVEVPTAPSFNTTTDQWAWQCTNPITGGSIACTATYNPSFVAPVCGSANGSSPSTSPYTYTSAPSGTALCTAGIASTPVQNHGSGQTYNSWNWTCTGTNLSSPVACSAQVYAPPPGSCGSTSDTCTSGSPAQLNCVGTDCTWICTYPNGGNGPIGDTSGTCSNYVASPGVCGGNSGICTYGTLVSAPKCDSSNPPNCSWQCQGDATTSAASCTGPGGTTTLDPNGACGLANGLPSYTTPNQNLCKSGELMQPPGVQGSGPWTWTCQGSVTNSALCSASICTQCSGNTSRNNSASWNVSGTVNGCNITTATGTWTETDDLLGGSSNTVNGVIAGSTQLGSFSVSVAPGTPPTHTPPFCSPCYVELNKGASGDGISNFSVVGTGTDSTGKSCTQTLTGSAGLQ